MWKETYMCVCDRDGDTDTHVKRKLYMCQKRPMYMWKETYMCVCAIETETPTNTSKESYIYVKRDLCICGKRRIFSCVRYRLRRRHRSSISVSVSVETHTDMSLFTYAWVSFDIYVKRDLCICQKRHIWVCLE